MPAALMIKEIAVAIQEKAASSIPEFKNLDTGKGSLSPQKNELSPLKNEIPEFSNKGALFDSGGVKELTQKSKEIPIFHDVKPQAVEKNVQNEQSPVDTSNETKDIPENAPAVSQVSEVPFEKTDANGKEGAYSNNEVKPENPSPQNDIGNISINGTDEVLGKLGLTEEEKQQIKNETGWSDEIVDDIGSMKEYEVYNNAGLQEVEINGKKCLVRTDIDWEQSDSMGRTNKERAEAGISPINREGVTIELHHIGQKNDGSLAELTQDEHRSRENYSVLHDTKKESEIDRQDFNSERSTHWQSRVNNGGNNA